MAEPSCPSVTSRNRPFPGMRDPAVIQRRPDQPQNRDSLIDVESRQRPRVDPSGVGRVLTVPNRVGCMSSSVPPAPHDRLVKLSTRSPRYPPPTTDRRPTFVLNASPE